MNYRNDTGKTQFFRVKKDDPENKFVSVEPGEVADLPIINLDKHLPGMVKVDLPKEKPVEDKKEPDKEPVKEDKFDLNKDGKVDDKDAKLAGKVLANQKGKTKKHKV